ncbi:MAG TPA: hypothetical protein VN325_36925 [Steroidobacteraceae bacterium]|nr:hypothetical protein [Steroidobacteraceae bacterium]
MQMVYFFPSQPPNQTDGAPEQYPVLHHAAGGTPNPRQDVSSFRIGIEAERFAGVGSLRRCTQIDVEAVFPEMIEQAKEAPFSAAERHAPIDVKSYRL